MTSALRHIRAFCAGHRHRLVAGQIVGDLSLAAALTLGGVAGAAAAFALFPWTALTFFADGVVIAGIIALPAILIARLSARPSLTRMARTLEEHSGLKHSMLSAALQLDPEQSPSPELARQAQRMAAESIGEYPKRLPGAGRPGLLVAAGVCAIACATSLTMTSPSLLAYWDLPLRLLKPVQATIEPGTAAIPSGAPVTLRCTPRDQAFPSARLVVENIENRRSEQYLIRPDASGNFSTTLDPSSGVYSYQFTIGAKALPPETLTVVAPPTMYSLSVGLDPPAYTGRPDRRLREGEGSMAVYPGTRAAILVGSHFPLRAARFIGDWGDTIPFKPDGDSAAGELTMRRSGRYTFSLEDTLGQTSDSLPWFYIDMMPDYPPAVRLIKPGINVNLSPEQQETLWVEGIDDIAVKKLALYWRRNAIAADSVSRRDISPRQMRAVVRREVAWDLSTLGLYPGDTVYYWARALENRPWKPRAAFSDTFWFRVPSFAEIHEQIAGKESRTERALESVREHQDDMREKLEKLMQSAGEKEQLSWEDKQILEDLDNTMRAQADSLQEAIHNLEETVSELKEQGVLNEDIAKKMDEVRDALTDLLEEYGDSLLFKDLEQAEEVAWKDIQQAVSKMNELLPDLQQHLENTLQYLDMLKRDQELANLAARAEKLAAQQLQIAESQSAERMRQQQAQTEETGDLLADIARGAESDSGKPLVDKSRLSSMEQAQKLHKQFASRMSRNQMPSQSSMNQMSGALQSMSQELSRMLSSAMMQQMQKDQEMLMALAGDALDMAEWQKELANSAGRSKQARELAANQQAIRQALRKSLGKLDSLKAVPPNLLQDFSREGADALASIDNSLSAMSGRNPGPALDAATHGLNGLAGSLLAGLESLQQGRQSGSGGAEGLMPGMRKLSGKQAAVNAATGELLRQMLQGKGRQQGGQSAGGSAEARRQAEAAQRELADQLERLAEKYGEEAGEGMQKRIEELEQEARRLARMLEKPSQELRERQDRFLVRLLQTTLSTHKEGEGKEKRKSSSAAETFSARDIGSSRDAFRDADTFYNLRSRALEGNYPESYRLSVQAYFDSLGVLFLKE